MVYVNLRINVTDFEKWLSAFQGFETFRKEGGATGANQIYHDIANPNDVTLILEWESAEKAQAFLNNPQTKANMSSAGVIGRPSVLAIQTKV